MIKQALDFALKTVISTDQFGDPVVITFKGKNSHRTTVGGFCSIVLYTSLMVYLGWRFHLFRIRERDEYYLSTYFKKFEEHGAHMLSDMSVNFQVFVNDINYDNEDNPYGKIVYHNYINMDGPLDTVPDPNETLLKFQDNVIPI